MGKVTQDKKLGNLKKRTYYALIFSFYVSFVINILN